MAGPREYDTTVRHVEALIDIWLEDDETGDATVFEEHDVCADDVIHNPGGEPPVVGTTSALAYLEDSILSAESFAIETIQSKTGERRRIAIDTPSSWESLGSISEYRGDIPYGAGEFPQLL